MTENDNKELDKILDDYKGALQQLEEYDQHCNKQISRKMLWEKVRLKALKYDMADSENMKFQSVSIPQVVVDRLEVLRDSKELPMSMPALITGITEIFIKLFESR